MEILQKTPSKTAKFKPCKVCGGHFWGRANKLYHPECKMKLNNETAGKRRKKEKPLRDMIAMNDLILKVSFRIARRHNKKILIQNLISSGFKIDKYNYTVELETRNVSYNVCYKYAWYQLKNSDEVSVVREQFIRELKQRKERELL